MGVMDAPIVALLVVGVGIEVLSCLGVFVAADVFDKLHFTGPATVTAPALIALAIVIEERVSQASLKAFLVAALLAALGPLVTHATARSARIRQYGGWEPREGEDG
jgi:monovalent cation/proton antiporter MnhG/PhaG subunit